MTPDEVREQLEARRLVPVVVLDDAERATALGQALAEHGLPIAEVTLRSPGALGVLEGLADRGDLLVGAGTVLEVAQVEQVAAAGARFVVSPGLDREVVGRSLELGLLPIPGVATATEVQAALRLGVRLLKFFPAGHLGGPGALQALAGPFPQVRFVPTGGIGLDDLPAYLGLGCVAAVGGSFMVPAQLVRTGDPALLGPPIVDAVARAAAPTFPTRPGAVT